jgi:hypothetical protein
VIELAPTLGRALDRQIAHGAKVVFDDDKPFDLRSRAALSRARGARIGGKDVATFRNERVAAAAASLLGFLHGSLGSVACAIAA